jgi:hypothetical protein
VVGKKTTVDENSVRCVHVGQWPTLGRQGGDDFIPRPHERALLRATDMEVACHHASCSYRIPGSSRHQWNVPHTMDAFCDLKLFRSVS